MGLPVEPGSAFATEGSATGHPTRFRYAGDADPRDVHLGWHLLDTLFLAAPIVLCRSHPANPTRARKPPRSTTITTSPPACLLPPWPNVRRDTPVWASPTPAGCNEGCRQHGAAGDVARPRRLRSGLIRRGSDWARGLLRTGSMSTMRTSTICLRIPIWQTGSGLWSSDLSFDAGPRCRPLAMCRGVERCNRQVRHPPKLRFRCSESYLDVKRSVRRGT
jgi:hypothetical protein